VYLLTKGIKEVIKPFRVEERNDLYKFMVIFQHISRCFAEYNMAATCFLVLFSSLHVVGKGPDRFYAWPDALVLLKRKEFLYRLFDLYI